MMTERRIVVFLQLLFEINIICAQIHYPDDRYDGLVADLTAIRVERMDSPRTPSQPNFQSLIAERYSKLTLDLIRVAPTTSPYLAQADYAIYGSETIAGALSMVMQASVGQTFEEIANFLGFSSLPGFQNNPLYVQLQLAALLKKVETTSEQTVNFATAFFVQQDFAIRPAFQRVSETLFNSDIKNLDFRGNPEMAQHVINTWISERTNDKIPTLLNEPPSINTKAIIASVLYFQATWEYPFYEGGTQLRPFYINGRKRPSERKALMMSNGGEFPYYKDPNSGVEIMGFPYKGSRVTMYVVIPSESNRENLRKLENSLTPSYIDHLVNHTEYTEAVVIFPKMQLENTINLKPTLERLGVKSIFNPSQANLALLSAGFEQRLNVAEAPFVSPPIATPSFRQRPSPVRKEEEEDLSERLVFSRFGNMANCVPVYDPITNNTKCQQIPAFGNSYPVPLSARSSSETPIETLNNIRQQFHQNPSLVNPGLYADQIIHKVYIDITESGTEAAAATGVSLNRSGGRLAFRVDVPFLFFIYHEETKLILFWGSVKSPSPSISTQ